MSVALGATRVLKCPGNTSQADDQKTDYGKLTLNEEEILLMNHKVEGVSTVVSRYTICLRETEGVHSGE